MIMSKSVRPGIVLQFLEKPPLLRDEDPQIYYEFFESVVSETEPRDIIEWIWLVQFVNSTWDALRLRRLRAVYIDGRHEHALYTVLRNSKTPNGHSLNSTEYAKVLHLVDKATEQCMGDPAQLWQHKANPDIVPATAILQNAERLEILDRLIERAERRCDAIVQHLEVRRAVFAVKAREIAGRLAQERTAIGQAPILIEATAATSRISDTCEPSFAVNQTTPKDVSSPPLAADAPGIDQGPPSEEGMAAEPSAEVATTGSES
jgi:hypothetical protein